MYFDSRRQTSAPSATRHQRRLESLRNRIILSAPRVSAGHAWVRGICDRVLLSKGVMRETEAIVVLEFPILDRRRSWRQPSHKRTDNNAYTKSHGAHDTHRRRQHVNGGQGTADQADPRKRQRHPVQNFQSLRHKRLLDRARTARSHLLVSSPRAASQARTGANNQRQTDAARDPWRVR